MTSKYTATFAAAGGNHLWLESAVFYEKSVAFQAMHDLLALSDALNMIGKWTVVESTDKDDTITVHGRWYNIESKSKVIDNLGENLDGMKTRLMNTWREWKEVEKSSEVSDIESDSTEESESEEQIPKKQKMTK